jgi:hypothetical protein
MLRLFWLALFCFAALGCVTVVRLIVRPGVATTAVASPDVDAPLAKGDRLPSDVLRQAAPEGGRLSYDILHQVGLDALKRSAATAAPIEAAADNVVTAVPKAEAAADNVVSWHWREGSKVVRRRQAQ